MDPKTIKKHSQIVRKRASSLVVTGQKEKTETGYTIPGHSGKVIETFFETILPGAASDLIKHPKKDRVIRVLAGGGFVILNAEGGSIEKRVQPGDEIVIKAGTTYRLATTSDQQLDLHVAQESKYAARMEIIEKSNATAEVSPALLRPAERAAYIPPGGIVRRGSKAKQQQLMRSSGRIQPGQIIPAEGVAVDGKKRTKPEHAATAAHVMNAKPSMGRFDEEGAG